MNGPHINGALRESKSLSDNSRISKRLQQKPDYHVTARARYLVTIQVGFLVTT